MKTKVHLKMRRGAGVLKAHFEAALEEMLRSASRFWHATYLERHFQMGFFKPYHYGLRVLGYRMKTPGRDPIETYYERGRGVVVREEPMYTADPVDGDRRVKHRLLGIPRRPLERTGTLKQMAKAGYVIRTKGKRKVALRLTLPRHAYQYRKDTGREALDKVQELTTITDAEVQAMAEAGKKDFGAVLRKARV